MWDQGRMGGSLRADSWMGIYLKDKDLLRVKDGYKDIDNFKNKDEFEEKDGFEEGF